jgi:hypothetical protein
MASRSRTTFKKRQKELARMEKQRDKAAKRMQRKTMKLAGGLPDLDGEPQEGFEIEGAETETADTETADTATADAATCGAVNKSCAPCLILPPDSP